MTTRVMKARDGRGPLFSRLRRLTIARVHSPQSEEIERLLAVKTQSCDRLTAKDSPDMTDNRNVHSLFAWPLSVEGCSMNKRTSHQSLPYLNLLSEIQASWLLKLLPQ